MDGFILDLRNKYQYINPKRPQYSPHKHIPIYYGATEQLVQPTDTSTLLNEKGITRIQGIVSDLLYLGSAVNIKLVVALSVIGAQQAAATEDTASAIKQLLDYVTIYPNGGIIFRKIYMIFAVHADTGFLNESINRSKVGARIFI